MKIINETCMCCSVCGVEASGLNEIQKLKTEIKELKGNET